MAAGLAFGTKYSGMGIIIVPFIAYLYNNFKFDNNKLSIKGVSKPFILGGVFLLVFLLTTPTIFLNWPEFNEKGFSFIVGHVSEEGHDGFDLKPEGTPIAICIYTLYELNFHKLRVGLEKNGVASIAFVASSQINTKSLFRLYPNDISRIKKYFLF